MEGPALIPENEGRVFKERHGFIYESCIETYFLNRTDFDVVLIENAQGVGRNENSLHSVGYARDIMYCCRNY